MRDIRTRIAKQSGVDLSNHQIQELAARRLEALLDVRSLNPALMEQLRRSVGGKTAHVPSRSVEPPPRFDEAALFQGGLRGFFRPILKLFFDPTPLVDALNATTNLAADAARRDAERERQQLEWNALHYELLRRLVTEVSRGSLESQGLGLRVEALSAKVDFNDRRVRGLEGTVHDATARTSSSAPAQRSSERSSERSIERPSERSSERPGERSSERVERLSEDSSQSTPADGEAAPAAEGPRRRRRRRRGRRTTGPGETVPGAAQTSIGADVSATGDEDGGGFEDEGGDDSGAVTAAGETTIASASAESPSPATVEPAAVETPSESPAAPLAPAPEPGVDDPIKG